jgi:hypothetical protein
MQRVQNDIHKALFGEKSVEFENYRRVEGRRRREVRRKKHDCS